MTLRLPARLAAPAPGWETRADVIVVGSGVAGLTAAVHLRALGLKVLVVTKSFIDEGSTRWAQGGIAAALDPEDSPDEHERDTLVAGAGLCDARAVHQLVNMGPASVRQLVALGARFDLTAAGEIALTREGGHLRDRIAHAGGDATGAEIFRALVEATFRDPGVEVIEHALVLDLLKDDTGAAQGVTLHVLGAGQENGVGAALAPAVVLATGGIGQVFAQSTNPPVATGDGVALAIRAEAAVADLEFVQFHPTVLWTGSEAAGQQPLVSEAVRGEGGFLVDGEGRRFMQGVHPLADLGPRDVVAKAIMRRMQETGEAHMWLDARHLGSHMWEHRFPTILESCRSHGVDPRTDLIPVAPAQHYASGGVRTDLDGRTSVPGLFAAGETACTGVHGANRLASNSLLEGLVFPERIAAVLAGGLPEIREPITPPGSAGLIDPGARSQMQGDMTDGCGVLRTAASMAATASRLAEIAVDADPAPSVGAWETTNLHTVSSILVHHAAAREETRGSHWREDFPDLDDTRWRVRLVARMDDEGVISTDREPVAAHDYRTPGT